MKEQKLLAIDSEGKGIKFRESDFRLMGRGATGIRVKKLLKGKLVSILKVNEKSEVLIFTKNGYGIKFPAWDMRTAVRGGQGVRIITLTLDDEVTGAVCVNN
jgi:DNA gyrase subunit A